MATQALIQINGVGGSNTDLPLNVTVNLTNVGAGGETTYEWTLLSQPEGAQVDFLDSGSLVSTLAAPQFIPTKEGSYLVRLIVNKGLVDEAQNQVIAAVLELQTGNRIPAALETTEVDASSGWAYSAVNDILQRVTRLTDSGIFVCNAGEALSPGDVVHMTEMVTLATGLPGERKLPRVMKANASSLAEVDGPLGVMVGQVDGDFLPVAAFDLCRVMSVGALSEISLAGGTGVAGDPVYVDDTGALSLTPGTYIRQVGDVAKVYPGPVYDVAIAAVANSIPRGNAFGDLTGFYPAPTIAAGAVTASKLATNAVEEAKIAAGAVTTNKIGNLQVTTAKLEEGAINGTTGVTANKLSPQFFFVNVTAGGTVSSTTPVTVASIANAVLVGRMLRINLQSTSSPGQSYQIKATNSNSSDHLAYMRVVVTGSTNRTFTYTYHCQKNQSDTLAPISIIDTFLPGTYDIDFQLYSDSLGVSIAWDDLTLIVTT